MTIKERVERLFWTCNLTKNPVLTFSRACSKVGYLARTKDRHVLHSLESALNEQKHGILADRFGQRERASRHYAVRDLELAAFHRAVAG